MAESGVAVARPLASTATDLQNPSMTLDTPLTEAEFARLDDFLMSDDGPAEAMETSMLDGYLAAVSSGPSLVMPDQMLRWVWDTESGEESPKFKHNKQAKDVIGLILRHYQHVNDSLNDRIYEPRIMEREHEGLTIPIIDEWCMGYYIGIAADAAAWTPLLASQPNLFTTILLYGTSDGWENQKTEPLTAGEHEAAADALTETAQLIHAFWLERRCVALKRGEAPAIMPSRTTLRNPRKVGRNDPCPCGSGKKFKHCHGGPTHGETGDGKQLRH